jgi:RNA polymerase sigma factor (sigma-70 family)
MAARTVPQPIIDPTSAAALLIAVQRGREGALDELIRACTPVVRFHAQRSAWRADDVEDIMQEVWMRVLLKAGQIRNPLALLAWLRVVTQRVANELGHHGNRLVPTSTMEEEPAPCVIEDDVVEHQHRDDGVRRVRQAVAGLRQQDQRLLMLLHRDDRPGYAEISRQVRRPVGSLGPSRSRLLARLRQDRRLASFAELRPAV